MRLFDKLNRIKDLESMFLEARKAIAFYIKWCEKDPSLIEGKFRKNIISSSLNELESTFIVRIFAEFEEFLRCYWAQSGRKTNPHAKHLIDFIAAKFKLDPRYVHNVRSFRNSLLHGGEPPTITLTEARKYVCTFLGQMNQPAILPADLR